MKKIVLLLAISISVQVASAQNYLDVLKVAHLQTTLGNVDNENETDVSNTNIETYFPIPISGKFSALAGFTYENTRLGLANKGVGEFESFDRSNLIMTRLNLGVKVDHGNNWSGTYVALPKLASDFDNLGGNDFQMGGLALLQKKYSSRYNLKFGAYVSSENFGATVTPLIGIWYKSKNRKLYVNATLPIRADVNYSVAGDFSVGANLLTSIKSYNLSQVETGAYVQEESIRFSGYASYGFFNDVFIVRGKVGLDTTDFGVYDEGDTIGVQVLTFAVSGDDRNRRNSEFSAAPFFGLDLIFRTNI